MSCHAFEPHYNGTEKYIGLEPSLQASGRIVYVDEEKEIAPGLTLYNRPDAVKVMDFGSCGLNVVQDGVMQPEDFRHEQYLLAEENGKRILFSGCSHRGILNIMHWFQPDVLIGGFHLSKFPLDETLASFADRLNTYPTTYYTCHCTGTEQYRFMQSRMKNLHYISAGDSITL
jgi:7,8-dihydropterin-6-yl-methyl-4-(beta-D-ribofuranosyl)aminobenzene 5'-phosphate synthase